MKNNLMSRTFISDAKNQPGLRVEMNGFVQTLRDQKSVQFIILRDRTGLMQIVVERSEANARLNRLVSTLQRESAVRVTGKVVSNPAVKLGEIELQLETLEVDSMAASILPIDIFGQTETDLDKRQDWRFLELRRPENQLIFQVQTTIEQAMRNIWLDEGFVEIHTPKLMGSPSEGGAELFTLDYFGQTASLAQSPQFFKQMAMASGMERVFEIGPAFRAEPSFTNRHGTEFSSVDVEFSWIESHYDVMAFEEKWLQRVLEITKARHGKEVQEVFDTDIVVPGLPFPKILMEEAQAILKQKGHIPPDNTKKGDLDPQGEKLLCEYALEKFGHEFVFITDYPVEVRPFYHMRHTEKPGLTKSFDLLWKSMEITTGAQREHRYDILVRQALEKGVKPETIQWYLDFFRFGCPPHGGFGFGLARLLALLLNLKNIRDVEFLHRSPNRLVP
jgi:nondiscriminating aspartyl-tRNA synthetase